MQLPLALLSARFQHEERVFTVCWLKGCLNAPSHAPLAAQKADFLARQSRSSAGPSSSSSSSLLLPPASSSAIVSFTWARETTDGRRGWGQLNTGRLWQRHCEQARGWGAPPEFECAGMPQTSPDGWLKGRHRPDRVHCLQRAHQLPPPPGAPSASRRQPSPAPLSAAAQPGPSPAASWAAG